MSDYKTVMFPVEVPKGKYCWEWTGERSICGHYDGEGNHAKCSLGFCIIDEYSRPDDPDGIEKPIECKELKKEERKC